MANITFKGDPTHSIGTLPKLGTQAPDFTLVGNDLIEVTLADVITDYVILNITPSLDTGVCANSAKRFDRELASRKNVTVLNISKDLPFANTRFCTAHNITHIQSLSGFRDSDFGRAYGVELIDSPLKGLYSRAVLVLDKDRTVIYTEQVSETTQEPDYPAALAFIA